MQEKGGEEENSSRKDRSKITRRINVQRVYGSRYHCRLPVIYGLKDSRFSGGGAGQRQRHHRYFRQQLDQRVAMLLQYV